MSSGRSFFINALKYFENASARTASIKYLEKAWIPPVVENKSGTQM
jgi:hypothetical protein